MWILRSLLIAIGFWDENLARVLYIKISTAQKITLIAQRRINCQERRDILNLQFDVFGYVVHKIIVLAVQCKMYYAEFLFTVVHKKTRLVNPGISPLVRILPSKSELNNATGCIESQDPMNMFLMLGKNLSTC